MTKMIYRPQTTEKKFESMEIHKFKFGELPVDAIIVAIDEADNYTSKGWFVDPNDMKKPRRAKNDSSNKASS